MTVRCSGCGSSLSDEASFCEQCGGRVGGPSTTEPTYPTDRPQPPRADAEGTGPAGASSVSTAAPPDPGQVPPQVGRAQTFRLPNLGNKKWWVVAVAVVAVAAVVAVVGVRATMDEETPPPEESVHAFFTGLRDRDAKAALAQLEDAGIGLGVDEPSDALLSDKALAAKAYEPPKNVEVGEATEARSGDGVMVHVSYTVAGENVTKALNLRLTDIGAGDESSKRWLINKWGADGATGGLYIEPGVPEYEVNGVTVVTDENETTIAGREWVVLAAFPGTYRVGIPASPLVGGKPQRAGVLTNGDSEKFKVPAKLKDSGVTEVRRQVKAYLDKCAAQSVLSPQVKDEDCPFTSFGSVEGADDNQRNITWTIERYPKYDVELQAERGEVYVSAGGGLEDQGIVQLRYTADDGFTQETKRASQEQRFSINGPVDVHGGSINWTPA